MSLSLMSTKVRTHVGKTARMSGTLGLGALFIALPRTAMAQFDAGSTSTGSGPSITISPTVYRFYPNGVTSYPVRDANVNPNDINFRDCDDNIALQFNLTISGLPTTDTIEVWAGTTDCSVASARELGDGPYCWQVAPPGTFANSQQEYGLIYARNITRFIGTTTADNEFESVSTIPGPEACHTQTTSGSVALTLYFLYMAPGSSSADAPASYTTYGQNVDMVGPIAPTLQLPVGVGDGLLLINWTPQIDSTIQGFQIFAQDQGPGGLGVDTEAGAAIQTTPIYCGSGTGTTTCQDSGAVSADATVDASCTIEYPNGTVLTEVSDASSLSELSDADLAGMGCQRGNPVNAVSSAQQAGGGTCDSNVLIDLFTASVTNTSDVDASTGFDSGVTPITTTTLDGSLIGSTTSVGISEIDASTYGVGNVGGSTTSSATITSITYADGTRGPLINGHQYAIAVAAYDDDGNVGALSNLGCQTPAPVTTFWDKYQEDGGTAGTGFCTLTAVGAPAPFFASIFGAGFVGAAAARRGRRRKHRSKP
jgi:hypothetical protein